MNDFLTISGPSEGHYKEKGSKFLGFAYPVTSPEEIQVHLSELKKVYHDARHHCYAYIIGLKHQSFRANDDGEPNHSAGDPILGQIRSKRLTNCLVVVVRYFGGTKLGVSGLINAYKIAADDALTNAKTISICSKTSFRMKFGYEVTTDVERTLNEFDIDFQERSYKEFCEFKGEIRDEEADRLKEKLEILKGVTIVLGP